LEALSEYSTSKTGQDLSDVIEILEDPDQLWDGDTPLIITDNSFGYGGGKGDKERTREEGRGKRDEGLGMRDEGRRDEDPKTRVGLS
jgi:hypothetical protein